MNVQVHLVPARDAFVALPPSVVEQIHTVDSSAATMVFKLAWGGRGGAPKRSAFVSWVGGAAAGGSGARDLEVPLELGACLGLEEGQAVTMKAVKRVKGAVTVHVTPLTEDDWEVVELYPSELEAQLLNQLHIVSVSSVVPIWTSNGVCIRVSVDAIEPAPSAKTPCARLGNQTEVIVAPRARLRPGEEEDASGTAQPERRWPTQRLRLAPTPEEAAASAPATMPGCAAVADTPPPPADDSIEAGVSPATLQQLGWTPGMVCLLRPPRGEAERGCGTRRCSSESPPPAAAAGGQGGGGGDTADGSAAAAPTHRPADQACSSGVFVRLYAEAALAAGHVAVSAGVRRQLCLRLLTAVRVKPLDATKAPPPRPTQPLRLRLVDWEQDASAASGALSPLRPSQQEVLAAFRRWRQQRASSAPWPAVHGSLVRLLLAAGAEEGGDGRGGGGGGGGGRGRVCHVLLKFEATQLLLCEPDPEAVAAEAATGEASGRAASSGDDHAAAAAAVAPSAHSLPSATARLTTQDIRWIDEGTCPDEAKVTLDGAEAPIALAMPAEDGFWAGPCMEDVAGVAEVKARLGTFVRVRLHGAAQRARLLGQCSGGLGGLVLSGAAGTGKTTLVQAVAHEFRCGPATVDGRSSGGIGPQAPAFFLRVDCSSFVSAKASTVKDSWREIWAEAKRNAPSVLLCDDLDQLLPASKEGNSARETNALARFLAELFFPSRPLGDLRRRGGGTALLGPPPGRGGGGGGGQPGGGDGGAVALVACVKSKAALLPSLCVVSRFDRNAALGLPDAACRQAQLERLLTAQLGVGLAELDMAALAARTDSFAAADLRRLASRVAHHAAARAVGGRGRQQQRQQRAARPGGQAEAEAQEEIVNLEQAGCGPPSGRSGGLAERRGCLEVEATEADVELAMQALSPASLAGVKLTSIGSEVKSWVEVGGMAQVKKTLKEMFELPARYPELFASSPIRLRSGVMLYGPSGCGKTMIASTVAKECGMHFISVKGPELLNKYIGASEQNVRQKFEEAKVRRPARSIVNPAPSSTGSHPVTQCALWLSADSIWRCAALRPTPGGTPLHSVLRRDGCGGPPARQGQHGGDRPCGERLPDGAGRRRGAQRRLRDRGHVPPRHDRPRHPPPRPAGHDGAL
jgi:SpoVK/Ycf46/Vps4 family AAA+-type ATPase